MKAGTIIAICVPVVAGVVIYFLARALKKAKAEITKLETRVENLKFLVKTKEQDLAKYGEVIHELKTAETDHPAPENVSPPAAGDYQSRLDRLNNGM